MNLTIYKILFYLFLFCMIISCARNMMFLGFVCFTSCSAMLIKYIHLKK